MPMNATLGAAASSPSGWTGMAQQLAAQAQFVTLAVAGVLLLILLLAALFQTSEEAAVTTSEGLAASVRLPSWSIEQGSIDRAGAALLPVSVATKSRMTRTTGASTDELTPTELVALAAFRDRVSEGESAEDQSLAQRLSFVRWLVEHGRLEG